MGERFSIAAKWDDREQETGIDTSAQEYKLGYKFGESWDVSLGYREDEREDSTVVVPLTQKEGKRADAVLQVGYNSRANWNAYGFVQDTMSVTGSREENGRVGVGGTFKVTDKLSVDAEVSDGDLGTGGRFGSNYNFSDRSSMYFGYTLDSEQNEANWRSSAGTEGNLVAGVRSRLGESASVFLEERYQHGDVSNGMTHSTGISFAPNQTWNLGLSTDIGTLRDVQNGAETERLAAGVQIGYTAGGLRIASGIEYRNDDVEQADLSRNERKTWLLRNNVSYQTSQAGRLLGKLNHSESESSLGAFYDGGFTEAVVGYALRPVYNDRLNTIVKYTYFYNVPTTEQVSLQNIAAEFIQKSHVAAVDVTYDITRNLTIGGKYAYRLGQVSLDRESPEFFDNNANLFVLRGDYRFRENWEVLLETRLLDMPDLGERRAGALTTVSRYFGDHIKVGLGYNFTDFSDDLTDLNYDHQGLFLNVTGTL